MSQTHVAMVTGASSGIGASIAALLAAGGAHVVVCGRNLERAAKVAGVLREFGGSAVPVEFDVGSADLVEAGMRAVEAATTDLGPVDWLVNNAGLARSAPLISPEGTSDALFEEHMQVNFHGARRVMEALLRDAECERRPDEG